MNEWNAVILDNRGKISLTLYDVEWIDGVPVAGWVSNGGWYFRYVNGVVYALFTKYAALSAAVSETPLPNLNFYRYKLKPTPLSSKYYDDDIPF